MSNYEFILDEWLPRFPLTESYDRYSGDSITSPCHVCNNEQLRQEMQDQYHWGSAVPVDIFVMAEGEPDQRDATKVGGLPYLPASRRWPTNEDKSPMLFVAQFNFCHSKDIVGQLPGDILLVFVDELSQGIGTLHSEWQFAGQNDLVRPSDVPAHADRFEPCFGYRFRTLSYPLGCRSVPYEQQKYPVCRGKEVWSDFFLLKYQATQIGQAPFFIQEGDGDLPGRPLCMISSVGPDQHSEYPWVNRREPLMPPGEFKLDFPHLMIGDSGGIYLSIDEENRIHWGYSCF